MDHPGSTHGDEALGQSNSESHQWITLYRTVRSHVVGQISARHVLGDQVGPC